MRCNDVHHIHWISALNAIPTRHIHWISALNAIPTRLYALINCCLSTEINGCWGDRPWSKWEIILGFVAVQCSQHDIAIDIHHQHDIPHISPILHNAIGFWNFSLSWQFLFARNYQHLIENAAAIYTTTDSLQYIFRAGVCLYAFAWWCWHVCDADVECQVPTIETQN